MTQAWSKHNTYIFLFLSSRFSTMIMFYRNLFLFSLILTWNPFVSAIAPEYATGPCMNTAWQASGASTILSCNANEVTASVVDVEGPTSCKEGEFIYVNITTSIYFRNSRYDFAVYTATVPGGDPLFGDECALDVLGVEDEGPMTGGEIRKSGDGDNCYDVFGNGASLDNFAYQNNLKIPCEGNSDTGEYTSVFLQNCFAWRSAGQNEVCEVEGAYPGSSSKCDCAALDLGIRVVGPTSPPSISAQPSEAPSLMPSMSKLPTVTPSLLPSLSTKPTATPSLSPSLSTNPTQMPSTAPSISASPTIHDSNSPSISTQPTTTPSLMPTISALPTHEPSFVPSVSQSPTGTPSLNPSVTTTPTNHPSLSPSISTRPSSLPTMSPSVSARPTDVPSEPPSITTAPSVYPTYFPSFIPSSSPTLLAFISGIVFEDRNNNGLMEVDEFPLVNIPVRLYDQQGIVIKETASGENGLYQFDDIFPAVYTVGAVTGSDYVFSPVVGGGNQMTQYNNEMGISSSITLTEGDHLNDLHAGVYQPIVIGNKVWEDLNGNGIQESGEPALSSVKVSLRDENGNAIGVSYTDASGIYEFRGIVPGRYGVHFTLPLGYEFTRPANLQLMSGSTLLLNDIDSDAHEETGATSLVDVFSGDVRVDIDAGMYRPASVEGIVWHDLDANGIRESSEPGLEGVVIILFNGSGEHIDVATTDDSGRYSIGGLAPGTYYAEVLPTSGYFLSPEKQGGLEDMDSDFLPSTSLNAAITLRSGDEESENFDAGLWMYASVGDFIWMDTNADGIQSEDPLMGYPFPVVINLYNSNGQLLSSTQNDENGSYLFNELIPGSYEIEFNPEEETEIFSLPFKGDDDELDSNVDPDTKRAQVTLISGEINTSVDAGIITEAPYYPDWVHEVQVCTNDGFDPSWMTSNDGQIYLYRNKEACCENHFWWRIAQCMANEEYKFFRNGEICDTKIDFEDWELNSPAGWTDTTLFDTKDECCANLFPYDFSGCMDRSPVLFKFEFCLDVGSLLPPIDCQTADIYANVMEDAINQGLGDASDANITRVGDATLVKVDGSTQCGGSLGGQGFINDLTGTAPDISDASSYSSTSICGVITTESYNCTQDDCLTAIHDSIVTGLNNYVNNGDLTATLQSLATTRLPPVPELQVAVGETGSLNTFNLLLPTTMSDQIGELKYAKDGEQCVARTAFATWETPYDSLQECCQTNFNWKYDACCDGGGGCNDLSSDPNNNNNDSDSNPNSTGPTPVSSPTKYYANWIKGQLCDAKPANEFQSWELPYSTLDECCNEKFSYDMDGCCASQGMGGCADSSNNNDPPSPLRYYPTWSTGKLCQAKSAFEDWEQSYVTLQDCCDEHFSYSHGECCGSEGMGGCV